MERRQLGRSGLKVSAIALGAMTFDGTAKFQYAGNSDLGEANRMVDMAPDAGVNLLDTSDQYSMGTAEEMVGEAIKGKRGQVLLHREAARLAWPSDAGRLCLQAHRARRRNNRRGSNRRWMELQWQVSRALHA